MSAVSLTKSVINLKSSSASNRIVRRGFLSIIHNTNNKPYNHHQQQQKQHQQPLLLLQQSSSSMSTTPPRYQQQEQPSQEQLQSEAEKYVLLERRGDKGIITLDRPKALNALNMHMAKRLAAQLKQWDSDSQIKMVVIKSASEKAFCAGGDVKGITLAGAQMGKKFFFQEYTLNNLIASLSVPYVALIEDRKSVV